MNLLRYTLLSLAVATASGPLGARDAVAAKTQKKVATKAQKKAVTSPVVRMFDKRAPQQQSGTIVTILENKFLDAQAYGGIRNAALALLNKYDPKTHYFVGLGRDPAPIIAFLQNLGVGNKDVAMNFPASSNQAGRDTPAVMKKYVNKLIPADIRNGKKTIVVVDATSSGRALDHYVPNMAPHLKGHKVIKVAYTSADSGAASSPGDKVIIKTTRFKEVEKFPWAPYESIVSEFPRHGPGVNSMSEIKTSRPEYMKFRKALMKRMKTDKKLDTALASLTKA